MEQYLQCLTDTTIVIYSHERHLAWQCTIRKPIVHIIVDEATDHDTDQRRRSFESQVWPEGFSPLAHFYLFCTLSLLLRIMADPSPLGTLYD